MKAKFFYWLKFYFGFTNKESKGFVLVIPMLILLMLTSVFIRKNKQNQAAAYHQKYQLILDSLQTSGVALLSSPDLPFNPMDTLPHKSRLSEADHLNKIYFSEADSSTLQIVPGIGPALAGRIIKYQVNLGGFYQAGQLNEVYGINAETARAIWDFFDFDVHIFRKIAINHADVNELAKHPYISYSQAKVLVAYRAQHGAFHAEDDLLKIRIFKADWIRKVSPYLDFED